jgi:GT2 family glycosyltransferase
MVNLMQFDDSIGVVTAKVVFDSGAIHCCGVNVVDPWGWHERPMRPREPLGRRQWLNRLEERPDEGDAPEVEDRVAEVDSGIGCCMMYRRADALEAGGYDREWAPVWFDDVDLCLKIRARGRKAFYTPEVRAIHHFGSRSNAPVKRLRQSPPRLAAEIGRRVARRLPHGLATRVEERLAIDFEGNFTHRQCLMLRHHHAYWRAKWGWDARNPDMDEIRRRWGDTELWWRYDDERRAAGQRIGAAYEQHRTGGVAPAERGS